MLDAGGHGAGRGARARGGSGAGSGSSSGTRGGASGAGGRGAAGSLGAALVRDAGGAVLLAGGVTSVCADAVGKGGLADVVGHRVRVLVHVGRRAISAGAGVVESVNIAGVGTGAADLTADVLLGSAPRSSGGQGDGTGVNREGRVASGDNSESRQGGNGNLGDEHVGEKCDTEVYRKRRVYTVVANK